MKSIHPLKPLQYRAIWISEVHLGSKACRAEFLLDFLHSVKCEHLYLVRDIVDLWARISTIRSNGFRCSRSFHSHIKHQGRIT